MGYMTDIVSRSSRVLSAVGVVVIGGTTIVSAAVNPGGDTLRGAAIAAFLCLVLYVAFWRPRLVVGETGVVVINPLVTHAVDWGAIDSIDTKWGLTLVTARKRISVWAAPAPGRHAALRAVREQGRHLPESTYVAGTIRPGDLVTSESGSAAAIVRARWEHRTSDDGRVTTRVHTVLVIALIATALAAIAALFV